MEQNRKIKKRVRKWIRNNILNLVSDNTELVLFGCVPMAKVLRDSLLEQGLNISAIVDNNPEKTGLECLGTTIHLPNQYLIPYKENIIVLIWHDAYWKEMKKQTMHLGYKDSQIKIFHTFPVIKDNISVRADVYHFLAVIKGWRKYKREISGNDMVFLCPYKGTGDVYMAGGYFREYLRNNNIKKYSFLVLSEVGRKVASLFGIENIKVVSRKESENLLLAYDFLGDRMSFKPLLYWGWRTKKFVLQRFCKSVNFDDMFRYDVFDLDIDCLREPPSFTTANECIDEFFESNGLKKGKTVIIAPYAGSFNSDIPMDFWRRIVNYYSGLGYDVCTNCASNNEERIDGTKAICFDLRDTVPILDSAGVFIGLRSGLCDIGSTSKCKKVILYESGFNASQYEFFSLNIMGLCDDAIEIIYNGEDTETFFETFLHRIEEGK